MQLHDVVAYAPQHHHRCDRHNFHLVPLMRSGLQPNLDLQLLNQAPCRLLFKISCLDSASTQTISLVCLRRSGISVQGPSILDVPVSSRLHKVAEAALALLMKEGIWILNYLNYRLILAHSQDLLFVHRDLVLRYLSQLGLQVNREKSKLYPVQSISFLRNEHAQSVLNWGKTEVHCETICIYMDLRGVLGRLHYQDCSLLSAQCRYLHFQNLVSQFSSCGNFNRDP